MSTTLTDRKREVILYCFSFTKTSPLLFNQISRSRYTFKQKNRYYFDGVSKTFLFSSSFTLITTFILRSVVPLQTRTERCESLLLLCKQHRVNCRNITCCSNLHILRITVFLHRYHVLLIACYCP